MQSIGRIRIHFDIIYILCSSATYSRCGFHQSSLLEIHCSQQGEERECHEYTNTPATLAARAKGLPLLPCLDETVMSGGGRPVVLDGVAVCLENNSDGIKQCVRLRLGRALEYGLPESLMI